MRGRRKKESESTSDNGEGLRGELDERNLSRELGGMKEERE